MTLTPRILVPVLPLLGALLAACGSSSGGDGASDGADPGATGEAAAAAGQGTAAQSAACSAFFDGLVARKERCGPGRDMFNLDIFEAARPDALAHCLQQAANPGTGYTEAFYATCNAALAEATCDDDDGIVKACWEPRGSLGHAAPCATDDQCAEGYCKLPEGAEKGSTCGTCDVPVWGKEGDTCRDKGVQKKDVKCAPGLSCSWSMSYTLVECRSPRMERGADLGEQCDHRYDTDDGCKSGLECVSQTCVARPIARLGEACARKNCEAGSTCLGDSVDNAVCVKLATLGEPCEPPYATETHPPCNAWLECSPTRRCVLPEILECH